MKKSVTNIQCALITFYRFNEIFRFFSLAINDETRFS